VTDALEALRGGLVVSVQAAEESPLAQPAHMAAIASAAAAGGAAAIRAEGEADIAAIKAAVDLPLIGLVKRRVPGSAVYITPELEDGRAVARAGADIVATDATLRPRPGRLATREFLAALARELSVPLLADVDTVEAGRAARSAGADAVATTLAGYTGGGRVPDGPDLDLVAALSSDLDCPVLAEGRYGSPESAREARRAGAFAVVVGTAISDPEALTRRFAGALDRRGVGTPG